MVAASSGSILVPRGLELPTASGKPTRFWLESPPCATLSMLTYCRTSRSLQFPFGAVCSLSGSQPEIWSVKLEATST
jgi:hypothetical protein